MKPNKAEKKNNVEELKDFWVWSPCLIVLFTRATFFKIKVSHIFLNKLNLIKSKINLYSISLSHMIQTPYRRTTGNAAIT